MSRKGSGLVWLLSMEGQGFREPQKFADLCQSQHCPSQLSGARRRVDLEVKQTEGEQGGAAARCRQTLWTLGASEVEISYWGLDALEPATLRAEAVSALFTPHHTAKRGAPPLPPPAPEEGRMT